jgi:hypothetical protein
LTDLIIIIIIIIQTVYRTHQKQREVYNEKEEFGCKSKKKLQTNENCKINKYVRTHYLGYLYI